MFYSINLGLLSPRTQNRNARRVSSYWISLRYFYAVLEIRNHGFGRCTIDGCGESWRSRLQPPQGVTIWRGLRVILVSGHEAKHTLVLSIGVYLVATMLLLLEALCQ
jgi:hypothetical protein